MHVACGEWMGENTASSDPVCGWEKIQQVMIQYAVANLSKASSMAFWR